MKNGLLQISGASKILWNLTKHIFKDYFISTNLHYFTLLFLISLLEQWQVNNSLVFMFYFVVAGKIAYKRYKYQQAIAKKEIRRIITQNTCERPCDLREYIKNETSQD